MAMVTWFAGLFYLPRLFVYHAMTSDDAGIARFKIMERKLYRGITTPGAVMTLLCGMGMVWQLGLAGFLTAHWLHLKLCLIAVLLGYHLYLGRLVTVFSSDGNRHSHVYYRWLNEFPVLILVGAVYLAVFKPYG